MPALHALQKILRAHAHPQPETVSPGEFLEIEPDVFAFGISYNAEEVDKFEADLAELGVKDFPLKDRMFIFHDHAALHQGASCTSERRVTLTCRTAP